jgi:THO complex subunit 4
VKSAVLNHDDKGRSKGSATVIFKRNGDANKAYEEFHDRTLDGRPMRIELLVNPASLVAAPPARVPAAAPAAAPNGSRRGGRGGR